MRDGGRGAKSILTVHVCVAKAFLGILSLSRNSLIPFLMKQVLFLGLFLPWLVSCETLTLRQADETTFTLDSPDTGQSYEITVLLPPTYDADRRYPSVYLLDGHWHYLNVAADAQQMMAAGDIEDIILVSIAYADLNPNGLEGYATISSLRIDDLTAAKNLPEDERGGKSLAFRQFLVGDLIPRIEADYATGPAQRTLMGHSLGGYFGIWEMLTFSDRSPFVNVEAGSPALWWTDGQLLGELEAAQAEGLALPFDLHTTMGTLESVVWNAFFDEFEARIKAAAFPGLTYDFERYPKGHTANAEVGFREGLIYFFGR
jgi:hypothetical protein